jgi:hypothetical protein
MLRSTTDYMCGVSPQHNSPVLHRQCVPAKAVQVRHKRLVNSCFCPLLVEVLWDTAVRCRLSMYPHGICVARALLQKNMEADLRKLYFVQ